MIPPFTSRFLRPQKEVVHHWYAFAENFSLPPSDFYSAIEKDLAGQKVPGLEMSRLDWGEGGLLSDKRVYLRLARERLVFDICAAPFGTGYFFSCRTVEIPAPINPLSVLILFALAWMVLNFFMRSFGFFNGTFLLAALFACTVWLARNSVSLGLASLDSQLIQTPVIGPLYERFVRKETYYRQDTRLIYLSIVPDIVKKEAERVTSANGIKLLKEYECGRGAYRPLLVHLADIIAS